MRIIPSAENLSFKTRPSVFMLWLLEIRCLFLATEAFHIAKEMTNFPLTAL